MQIQPLFILYVADPAASARFYAAALETEVMFDSPDYTMLPLGDGAKLGLWRASGVAPAASVTPGGGELSFTVPDRATLDALRDRLAAAGVPILQEVTRMGFGEGFVVTDPDGHRLRPYVRAEIPQ